MVANFGFFLLTLGAIAPAVARSPYREAKGGTELFRNEALQVPVSKLVLKELSPLLFIGILMTAPILGCAPLPEVPRRPVPPTLRNQNCPALEDRLSRLMNAPDPTRFAQEQNIFYRDGLVRVVLELSFPDAELPPETWIQIEARSGAEVQVLVPLSELCRLSNYSQVKSVMAPPEIRPIGR